MSIPLNKNIQTTIGGYQLSIVIAQYCQFTHEILTNGYHYHNCYEGCLVLEGTGIFIHDEIEYHLQEGDIFMADPRVYHEIHIGEEIKKNKTAHLELVYFTLALTKEQTINPTINRFTLFDRFIAHHSVKKRASDRILSYIKIFSKESRISQLNNLADKHLLLAFCLEIIELLTGDCDSMYPDLSNQYPQPLDRACSFIASHYKEKLTLSTVAKYSQTSVRNLQYLFKKHLNKSVIEYINEKRMSVATGYLRMNFKVSEVSTFVGIEDISSFSRLFKKHYKISPKQFAMKYAMKGTIHGTHHILQ